MTHSDLDVVNTGKGVTDGQNTDIFIIILYLFSL